MYILWDNHSFIIGGPGYCKAVESVLTVMCFCFCLLVRLVITVHCPRTIWLDFNVSLIHWAEQNLSHFLGKGGISNAIVRILLNPAEGQNTTTDLERYAGTDGFQLRLYSLCSVDNHDTHCAVWTIMILTLLQCWQCHWHLGLLSLALASLQ